MSDRARLRWLGGAGALLTALVGVGLAIHKPGDIGMGSGERVEFFVGVEAFASAIWFAVALLVVRARLPRGALTIVLVAAAAMRALVLPAPPFLSSDVHRYVWDGMVQDAGISPYRYVPADPALAALRDDAIFPRINRAEYAPTIYPPVAQAFFAAVAFVSPTVFAMKFSIALAEAGAIGIMTWLLTRVGRPAHHVLIYAWCPVSVWEFAGNGHVDGLSMVWIGLALAAVARGREAAAGAALGAAILTKLLPAVIAPALWRVPRPFTLRALAMPLAAAAFVVGGYAAYATTAGARVLGFLPGYSTEEGIASGHGLFVPDFVASLFGPGGLIPRVYLASAALVLIAVAARLALGKPLPDAQDARIRAVAGGALLLATLLTVALSPHYPWYYAWLAYLACLSPRTSVLWLSGSSALLHLDPSHSRLLWPALIFLPAAALALFEFFRPGARADE